MTLDVRRLEKYHPRRSKKEMREHRNKLRTLEDTLTHDMGELLICAKDGEENQFTQASAKTKHDLKSIGPEMQALATEIGAPMPKIVKDYLHNVSILANWQDEHRSSPFVKIDDTCIRSCYLSTERLKKTISK